jgi:hypothetical protein
MKATENITEAIEAIADYGDLVTLLAELEAEGFFDGLDAATLEHQILLSDLETESDSKGTYEALTTLLEGLEAEGFFKDLEAATICTQAHREVQRWSRHQASKLSQLTTAMCTKTIACFDSNSTLTAKMSCTMS